MLWGLLWLRLLWPRRGMVSAAEVGYRGKEERKYLESALNLLCQVDANLC